MEPNIFQILLVLRETTQPQMIELLCPVNLFLFWRMYPLVSKQPWLRNPLFVIEKLEKSHGQQTVTPLYKQNNGMFMFALIIILRMH